MANIKTYKSRILHFRVRFHCFRYIKISNSLPWKRRSRSRSTALSMVPFALITKFMYVISFLFSPRGDYWSKKVTHSYRKDVQVPDYRDNHIRGLGGLVVTHSAASTKGPVINSPAGRAYLRFNSQASPLAGKQCFLCAVRLQQTVIVWCSVVDTCGLVLRL